MVPKSCFRVLKKGAFGPGGQVDLALLNAALRQFTLIRCLVTSTVNSVNGTRALISAQYSTDECLRRILIDVEQLRILRTEFLQFDVPLGEAIQSLRDAHQRLRDGQREQSIELLTQANAELGQVLDPPPLPDEQEQQ